MERALKKSGYEVFPFQRGEDAVRELGEGLTVDLVLTDLRMPGLDGIEVLKAVKSIDPTIGVLLITGFGTVESAVEAMKIGADDYLNKPVNLLELRKRVGTAIEKRKLSKQVCERGSDRLDCNRNFLILTQPLPFHDFFWDNDCD